MEWKQHFKRAIEHCGSQQKLARKIGLSQMRVSQLLNGDTPPRAEYAVAIEQATSGAVKAATLRPDLWPEIEMTVRATPGDPPVSC
jgi:DNA-binding transcriptional regulator YdaS (Cro superfamily)